MTDKMICVYPWDLLEEGPRNALTAIKSDCLCTGIALNCSYHSGRFLHPHRSGPKINRREGAGVSFVPDSSLYEHPVPVPVVEEEVAKTGILHEAREVCEALGLTYTSWVVGLHNSTLGRRRPDLCATNVYGDRYDYNLCPSNPASRGYLKAMIADVIGQLRPAKIALESPSFLGLVHGDHHELLLVALGYAAEFLFGLCFCHACQAKANEEGIDAEGVRSRVRQRLDTLLEEERGRLPLEFAHAEVASLLVEHPEIYEYVRFRLRTVESLLREVHEITRRESVHLEVMSSIFTRPASRAWEEGLSFASLSRTTDSIGLLAYHERLDEVQADIRWTRLHAPDHPLTVGFNVGHPGEVSAANLVSKARLAVAEGASAVLYYNYGLLTRTRMKWLAEANAAI